MSECKVIICEGLIGAGKTSLARELGAALGPETLVLVEPDEKDGRNPYLADYYGDPQRWSFPMQTHLLATRYQMQLSAQYHVASGRGHAVVDRSFYGDTCFAHLQVNQGLMTAREFETYAQLYRAMTAHVLLPSVCLRVLASPAICAVRIRKRLKCETGRKCEDAISIDYLQSLEVEIDHMVGILRSQGVVTLDVPWGADRDTAAGARGDRARPRRPRPGPAHDGAVPRRAPEGDVSAKLYFHYGCVTAGKSTALLQVARNYSDRGLRAVILVPEVVCATGVVRSRIGIEAPAISVPSNRDVFSVLMTIPAAVLVDEAQFLTVQQVSQLVTVVDEHDIPVLCYGLRTDFRGDLFAGSSALLAAADKIVEIRTICTRCRRKATMNLKVDERGDSVRGGLTVDVAGSYLPVCRSHWRCGTQEVRD